MHHLKKAGLPHTAIGEQSGVSLWSIERLVSEPKPTLGEVFDDPFVLLATEVGGVLRSDLI